MFISRYRHLSSPETSIPSDRSCKKKRAPRQRFGKYGATQRAPSNQFASQCFADIFKEMKLNKMYNTAKNIYKNNFFFFVELKLYQFCDFFSANKPAGLISREELYFLIESDIIKNSIPLLVVAHWRSLRGIPWSSSAGYKSFTPTAELGRDT